MDYFDMHSENNNFDDIVISKRSIMQSGLKKISAAGSFVAYFLWNGCLRCFLYLEYCT